MLKPCWSCSFDGSKKTGRQKAPGIYRSANKLVSSGLEQLGLVDQVHVGALEAVPLFGVLVVHRVHEAVPVLLVDEVLVGAVVEAGITALLTELDVLHVGFRREDTVVVFPGAQQFVQVLRTHLLGVFLQHFQLLFGHRQHLVVGSVVGRDTGNILVHDFLQTELQHLGRDVVGVDVDRRGVVLVLEEGTHRLVDIFHQLLDGGVEFDFQVLVVDAVLDHGLGAHAAFGVRAGGELVAGCAHAVAGGEQTLDRGHRAVAPVPALGQVSRDLALVGVHFVIWCAQILGTRHPDAAAADAHVEEVFPGFGFEVLHFARGQGLAQLGEGGHGVHVDGAAAFLHFLQHQVVAQARCGNGCLPVGGVVVQQFLVLHHVDFAVGVDGLGLEQQEPGADRAVAVLEAGGNEAVFHHGQLGAGLGSHRVGAARVPYRVPGTAGAFTDGARTEDVHAATGSQQDRLGLVDVDLVVASREADGPGDAVGVVLVVDQLDDEDALLDAVHAERLLGGFGNDPLVGLAVDHDLPFAGTHRLAAVLQRGQALRAVVALAVLVGFPDRQAPFLEQVHGVVDVAAEVVGEVVAGDAHQVVGDHAGVVGGILLGADVGVDRGQALRHGAGAIHRGLVDQLDLEIHAELGLGGVGPAHDFVTGAAASHATADQEDVEILLDNFGITKFSSHFVYLSRLLADQFSRIARAIAFGDAAVGRAGEETGCRDVGEAGGGLAAEGIDRAFGRGADRELEALQRAVAELDGPHDGVGTTQRLHHAAQRHDVGVVAGFDRLLRADLHAGIALPALLRLLVERAHGVASFRTVFVQFHQVVRADVHASGLILTFAAVALVGTNIGWHYSLLKLANNPRTSRSA